MRPRKETREEAISRADWASGEVWRLRRVLSDLVYADPPAAQATVYVKGEDSFLLSLYRPLGSEGGILLVTQTNAKDTTVHNFEAYKRAADERAAQLGGEFNHAMADALARLHRKRAELFRATYVAPTVEE